MKKLMIVLFFSITIQCYAASLIENNFTPLMVAIENKKSPLKISHLITQGENVNEINSEFLRCLKPVLRYALDRGTDSESVEIIRMLIKAGADVNAITYNRIDNPFYGMMPLLTYATLYSSAQVVQMFIDAGARDTALSEDSINFKKTALGIAQELEKTDIIKILNNFRA